MKNAFLIGDLEEESTWMYPQVTSTGYKQNNYIGGRNSFMDSNNTPECGFPVQQSDEATRIYSEQWRSHPFS